MSNKLLKNLPALQLRMSFGHTRCRIELNEKHFSASEGNNNILTVK